ncbi:DUF4178 domain-containing protein [Rhodobacterales bacterium HKCCE2091]|nr:DUF4178 domain-containing protein [Rhodobacterales bacterium HKCCE2091]
MTRAAELSGINCTQCGAGLSVLGGGRVLAHVCGYCGAVLDAQEDYRVLASIGKRDHPSSPLAIGMTVTVSGVPFTVIGTLAMIERWGGSVSHWVDHQVFSPTHGYAWLSFEQGQFVFTRKIRDRPSPPWITRAQVERSETPPVATLGGNRYRYYESGRAVIDFLEGEFNWLPAMSDASDYVTLMSDDAMLTFISSGSEREIERSVLLDRDAVAAETGVSLPSAVGTHPLAPYRPFANEGFMRVTLAVFAVASVVLALVVGGAGARRVIDTGPMPVAALPASFDFDVADAARLTEVSLATDVNNSWAVFTAEITGPDGQPVVAGERATEFYSGVEDGERWSEGSRRTSFRFRPAETGVHRITLELDETGADAGGGGRVSTVSLRVTEGRGTGLWLFLSAALFALGAAALWARRAAHRKMRWMGTDWTDED